MASHLDSEEEDENVSVPTSKRTSSGSDSGMESEVVPPSRQFGDNRFNVMSFSNSVVSVMAPSFITMVLTVVLQRLGATEEGGFSGVLAYDESSEDSTGSRLGGAVINALIILAFIVVVTMFAVLLFYFRCLKVIAGWVMFSTFATLAFLGSFNFMLIIDARNLSLDWICLVVIMWNFTVVGLIAVYYRAPLKLQQGYLIAVSALMALTFAKLPDWTAWAVLAAAAIYDAMAVLCPRGPLALLLKASERNGGHIALPGMVYTSGAPADEQQSAVDELQESSTNADVDSEQSHEGEYSTLQAEERARLPEGIKLGLGDLVFYSLLVSKAAAESYLAAIVCCCVILIGLAATLFGLGLFHKALPALPISIGLGITYYVLVVFVYTPFLVRMTIDSTTGIG